MQKQEEGPFRLKGLGDGNLLLCVQMGGVVVVFSSPFFSRRCAYQCRSLFPFLTFHVRDVPGEEI